MPAPTAATYSTAAVIAANTIFRDLIDSGGAAGFVRVLDSSDVLLAQVPLTDPCGTVNGTTGQFTLSPAGADSSADATGTAAYIQICNSDGVVHLAMPAIAGVGAVSGQAVFNTLAIVTGSPVDVLSAVIG